MKKISLLLFMGFLFIPNAVFASEAEDELRECLNQPSIPQCTVTQNVTLSSDLTLPYYKTVQFNNGADLNSNGHNFKVYGRLFMSEGSEYNGSILEVNGELTFYGNITIPAEQVINSDEYSNGLIVFEGVTINNGIIRTNVKIKDKFTNNKENGITKNVTVESGGTFTNNKSISLESLKVYNDYVNENTLINKFPATITITSGAINILSGTINNTGTIKYNQVDVSNEVYFGFNREYYTGNYPKITYIKTLDYNNRSYISDIIKHNNVANIKAENGLLLLSDVETELYYFHNLISESKNEYNVVGSAYCIGYYFMELLFNLPLEDVNIVYETLDLKNALIEGQFIKNSTIINNTHYDRFNNISNDQFYSNSYRIMPKDDSKPVYFQYKIKGFTTDEEVIVRGAINPNDELSALFDSNGGSYIYPVFETIEHLITKPTDPTKEGYKFMGWYTEKELTNKFNFDTAIDDNIILYASWEKLLDNPDTSDNIGLYIFITGLSILVIGFVTYKRTIRK